MASLYKEIMPETTQNFTSKGFPLHIYLFSFLNVFIKI